MKTAKKPTLATLKSYIRKAERLHIRTVSDFDGMTDCVTSCKNQTFTSAIPTDRHLSNTLGISGAWIVGRSRDSIVAYDDGQFRGYEVYNSCGHFVLAEPYLCKVG